MTEKYTEGTRLHVEMDVTVGPGDKLRDHKYCHNVKTGYDHFLYLGDPDLKIKVIKQPQAGDVWEVGGYDYAICETKDYGSGSVLVANAMTGARAITGLAKWAQLAGTELDKLARVGTLVHRRGEN